MTSAVSNTIPSILANEPFQQNRHRYLSTEKQEMGTSPHNLQPDVLGFRPSKRDVSNSHDIGHYFSCQQGESHHSGSLGIVIAT